MTAFMIVLFLSGKSFAIEFESPQACLDAQAAVVMAGVESVTCKSERN